MLWNKLYRREIIEAHHLRMDPAISWCEDFLFNLEYIRHANRFFAVQVPIYYYVKTQGSLASQGMSISKTVSTKLMLFEYYNQFYKTVLDEAEYEKRRLKVYRFLFDAAQDGGVLGAVRLEDGGAGTQSGGLAGEGLLFDLYRERKLLDYYLEPVAEKNGLTLPEAALLLRLRQVESGTRKDLADFAGLPRGSLVMQLKRLSVKGLVTVTEARVPAGGEKQLKISFPPAAEPVLEELESVWEEFEATRLSGFSGEEQVQYAQLARRVQDNIRNALR